MFEEEAREYKESKRHKSFREDVGNIQIDYNAYLRNIGNAFKDGAECGYQKGLKAKINMTTLSDYPMKDEWHEIESKISSKREISKKYMPKSEEKVLLKYHFSGDDEVHISD